MSDEGKKRDIETWSPLDVARSFEDVWRDIYREFRPLGLSPWSMPGRLLRPEEGWQYAPLVDIVDEGDEFKVRADIPGFSKEDINIEVTDESIELSGEVKKEEKEEKEKYRRYERSYSSFKRVLGFPEKVKPGKASASLKNGVLEVNVPKKEPTKPEKKHKVKVQ